MNILGPRALAGTQGTIRLASLFYLRMTAARIATLIFATIIVAPAYCAPLGELDVSFGDHGRLTVEVATSSVGWDIAQQPVDGKLLIAGSAITFYADGYNFAVLRLNPDGSPDTGFGTNGTTLFDFGGRDDYATELVLQPDGKIIVAGFADISSIGRGRDFAIIRLNPDGTLDSTFDGDGRVLLDLGGDDETISGIVLLPGGRLVVSGTTNTNGNLDIVFARFNANGTLDTTFGTGSVSGTTLIDSNGSHDQSLAMTMQTDGKFIACGQSGPGAFDSTNADLLAVRINANGSADMGFGTGGISRISTGTLQGSAQGCAALPDGTTMLAGFGGQSMQEDLVFVRLLSDGRLDTTFGNAGISSIDLGGSEIVQSIVRLADGTLGVVGLTGILVNSYYPLGRPLFPVMVPSEAPSEMFFARLDPDSGFLDTAFGNEGVTIVDFGDDSDHTWAYGRSLIQQADGKLVAVGASAVYDWDNGEINSIALARVDPAGAGSAGFAGTVTDWNGVDAEEGESVTISVRRSGGSTGELSVNYDTVGASATAAGDFTAVSGTLTWQSGEMDEKSITVQTTNDTSMEDHEWFFIVLSDSTNGLATSSVRIYVFANDGFPLPQPPPPPGSLPIVGRPAGGATGAEVLILLAMIAVSVIRRRSDRCRPVVGSRKNYLCVSPD